jgi:processive 1,2-diacylglycerol beta-glucosyltransferase
MPRLEVVPPRRRTRVLTVGSSMGAGHMTAARVFADHAARWGADARVVDYIALPAGPQGRLTRDLYRQMVTRAPWIYGAIMRGWLGHPGLFERLSAVGEGAYAAGVAREVQAFRPDVIVSTYNLAGQLLARMRRRGRLSVPVVAYVTDAGAHPYWVAAGADLHLVPLDVTGERLSAFGARPIRVVDPLVPDPIRLGRYAARARLRLSSAGPVVLVNGGSWGVGAVADAARCAGDCGAETYVLCGSDERLARTVRALPRCRPVGWTADVAVWIAAADVVVDSAGGTTCWEALAAQRPVIIHRPLAGHGRLNAAALEEAGLAVVTWSPSQLASAIADAQVSGARALSHGRDAAEFVLAAA